ncbi:PREDICTED: uncharacterized protein LOC106545416 [Thamnophis sirtalis]|uniref:60S ribosomal protein L32 n=1 Tax=Thamnophis sirtalis TaxID=35019 RepID=A0A6I9Y2S9_9SAUR|nr:PREDICTED: uncharacterized protein LOC106545416 [Thamnophis sirtalis]
METCLTLQILAASLFVKHIKVSPGVRLGHAEVLLTSNAKYHINRVGMKVYSIPSGSLVCNQENLFLGQLPKQLVIGFVDNAAFCGNYEINPFNVQHYNVNFCALYCDSEQIPAKPLQPDYEHNLFPYIPALALEENKELWIKSDIVEREGIVTVALKVVITKPALRPLIKPYIVKKMTKKFIHYQSDCYVKSRCNWHKLKHIDRRFHRRFKGQISMPNIGYGSNKKRKHMLPSGFWKFLDHNVNELDVLMMSNKSFCSEIALNVSSKNRKITVKRPAQLAIKVTNPNVRMCSKIK